MSNQIIRNLTQQGMDHLAKRRLRSALGPNTHVYLHVGSSKTGTTYIQNVFEQNRDALRQQGVLFPPISLSANRFTAGHSDLLSLKAQLNGSDPYLWMVEESQNGPDVERVILSCEYLLAMPYQLKRLKGLFSDFPLTVIVYLRRQDDWLDSIYKEHTEGRHDFNTLTADAFADEQTLLELNYEKLLEPIVDIFGMDGLLLKVYERGQFENGLLADFCGSVGVDVDALTTSNIPSNPSASIEDIEMMRILNKIPFKGKHGYGPFSMSIMELMYEGEVSKRRAMSPALRRRIVERYADANTAVARRFFDREDLFYAPLPDPDEPWQAVENVSLSRLEQFVDLLVPHLE
jgi:hypothetical protein